MDKLVKPAQLSPLPGRVGIRSLRKGRIFFFSIALSPPPFFPTVLKRLLCLLKKKNIFEHIHALNGLKVKNSQEARAGKMAVKEFKAGICFEVHRN